MAALAERHDVFRDAKARLPTGDVMGVRSALSAAQDTKAVIAGIDGLFDARRNVEGLSASVHLASPTNKLHCAVCAANRSSCASK